ncbi:hypothetical protein RCO28_34755 [Streptomyces sp. LHD-70]|uniref:hypothetical protein n=1 Tax=Streptomyces sp. LHD-70 TaxID=3072140 RepID=UPI00280D0AD3|nr:hypothetical protein [Streptomyces sp. LHD-70]MDQ8707595.1 hypothetical protein [Streptomyces sp. LHD-70]
MTYAVTVDTRIPSGAPEMDELQGVGAAALLEEGLRGIGLLEGPDGVEVEVDDTFVGVHTGGALLKIFVTAPALETAEQTVRSLVEEVLESSELLADWSVERCEVELHPDLVKESLDAADGPEAPPADVAARRARLAEPEGGTSADPAHAAAAARAAEARMRALAAQLRAFGQGTFGAAGAVDKEGGEYEPYGPETSSEDAELAAGVLVWATDVVLDELFQDAFTLDQEDTNVAECDELLWLLDDLPPRYALRYDAHFARRFLVTAVALTTRFTDGSFVRLSCVAEELALRLLLNTARVTLDTFGLLGGGVSSALERFSETVQEGRDHAWLYDDTQDGTDGSAVGEYLRRATTGPASWFTPFDVGRYVHPYAADEPEEGGRED